MNYYDLVLEVEKEGLKLFENCEIGRLKGLCVKNILALSGNIESEKERKCILCEELGHYYTSYGDIIDQSKIENRKQERRARGWSYEKLIPVENFIKAFKNGTRNRYELAEFLDVPEYFIKNTLKYYKEKFGLYCEMGNHIIYFDPLGVLEKFDNKEV